MNDTADDSRTSDQTEITSRIERERKEIEQSPAVPAQEYQPRSGARCHWCGRPSSELVAVHDVAPNGKIINERYKGVDCCGQRHSH